jgi:RimJ/RimL family protein N-acetyltransferase
VSFDPVPVTLTGTNVVLEPLAMEHAEELCALAQDPGIFRYTTFAPPVSPAAMQSFVEKALVALNSGVELPFVIRCPKTGQLMGSTRFLDIRRPHRALEIGSTWLGTRFQRTAVNTEAKFLLLSHAFEDLSAIRVQLKTDERNIKSQRAIERIGAKLEGTLRNQMILWDGFIRNAVFYSITHDEWPAVRQRIQSLIDKHVVK